MNDRFKFRSWDGKQFHYWGWNDEEEVFFNNALNFKKYPPCQCTGLKDKEGKLIYEGDVISCLGLTCGQYEDMQGYILYECMSWVVARVGGEFDGKARLLSMHKNLGVIGNIYENPELMGGGNA